MLTETARNTRLRRLTELIADIHTAMLTTTMPDGTLRSRPMATQQTEPDGDLWFFTRANDGKAEEIRANPHVNLSYSSPEDDRYVSVSGTATITRDRGKIEELWKPEFQTWFPGGLDDPDLAMMRVEVEQAEYWDASVSEMAEITERPTAEHEKLDLVG